VPAKGDDFGALTPNSRSSSSRGLA